MLAQLVRAVGRRVYVAMDSQRLCDREKGSRDTEALRIHRSGVCASLYDAAGVLPRPVNRSPPKMSSLMIAVKATKKMTAAKMCAPVV